MANVDLTFEVVGYGYTKRVTKHPVFKVMLKSAQGDSLTLVSDSRDIFEGYPEGESFSVTIHKGQKTLTELPSEE